MWTPTFWSPTFWPPTYWAVEIAAGAEVTLYSDFLAASTFAGDGDTAGTEYCTTFAAVGTTQQVRAYVAGTLVLDSGANMYGSGGAGDTWLTIVRESSTVLRVRAEFIPSGVTLQPVVKYTRLTGLTLTSTVEVRLTGTANAAGQIVAVIGTGDYCAGAA